MSTKKRERKRVAESDISSNSSDSTSDIERDSDVESSFSDSEEFESDDSDKTVDYDPTAEFAWSDKNVTRRSALQFTGSPGRKVAVSDTDDPLQYFRLFTTDEMLDLIIAKTNQRALQLMREQPKPPKEHSRLNGWSDVTQDELLVFIAVIMYQGIVQKPEVEMFWSTKPMFETPFVMKMMSERRFSLLHKCLHFVDNNNLPVTSHNSEKSWQKIQPFFDALIERFSAVYIPEQNVAIDESLMLWKGRLAMKQYIPLKRARFGLKSYELCESASGYIWKSLVHIGTAMKLDDSNDGLTSSRIVMTLARDLLGKGYSIFMDNWYSSPSLFRQLHMNQTDAVGTVRLNRKNMPNKLKRKIPRGQTVSCFTTDMMALKWMDKREVSLLSTYHDSDMTTTTTHSGSKEKPSVVVTYNKNMGAVDLTDQMLVAYPVERKRHKVWYKKQFRHLLNQTVLNSYILYKKDNPGTKVTHLLFRMKLIERLLECHHHAEQIPRRGRPSREEFNPLRLTGRHFPKFIPANEVKEAPTRRCKVCCSHVDKDGKKIRKETRYFCQDCDVALCPAPCFETYHTKHNY
jgi:hypothetical protein